MKRKPLVTIITVNYNQLDVTIELLNSIERNSYPNKEIIVVDNASEVNPVIVLNERFPEVKVILSEENLGFAGGNNLGIKESRGDFLFFINNDAEIIDGTIEKLVNIFDEIPNLGIVSPVIYYHKSVLENKGNHGKEMIQYAGTTPVHILTGRNEIIGIREWDEGQYNAPFPTAYIHGAAMMVSREAFENVGMMPENFFLYYEELDWCEQFRRKGYKIYVEPRAKIFHKESFTVSKMSTLKTFYLNRNRIIFMKRNRKRWQYLLFISFLFLFSFPKNTVSFILKGDFDNLKAFVRGVFRGLRD